MASFPIFSPIRVQYCAGTRVEPAICSQYMCTRFRKVLITSDVSRSRGEIATCYLRCFRERWGEGIYGGSSVGGGLSHNTVNRSLAKGRLQKKRKRKRREKTKQMD